MAAETRTLKELSGRSVIVEPATGSVLFVTNWPPTFQETDLKEFFSKASRDCCSRANSNFGSMAWCWKLGCLHYDSIKGDDLHMFR